MPNGKILVAGGSNAGGAPLVTVEILDMTRGSEYASPQAVSAAASMSFARSSATITVLPNGNILVAGGWDGAIARSDAEVYNYTTNSWTVVSGMSSGRFNHTATLLNTGNVLVCGGQTSAAAAVTATCDLFTPSATTPFGSFAAANSMLLARALHSSTLLKDGSVWVAGGWNPALPSPSIVDTTERYSSGQWQQSVPLYAERAYHTATLTGDNKVIVAGGYNAKSLLDPNGYPSYGYVGSSEIFDPSGGGQGTIVPGPKLQARVAMQSAVLLPNGLVSIHGGVGNTNSTAYTNFSATFDNGSLVGGPATAPLQFYLGSPVTGRIIDGYLEFFSASATTGTTVVDFFTGAPGPGVGLTVSLAGTTVGCDGSGTCGYISGDFPFLNANASNGAIVGTPLGGAPLTFGAAPVAIVVINKMVFGDKEFFVSNTNQWSFQPPDTSVTRPQSPVAGMSAVVTPSGDEFDIGGSSWNGAAFAPNAGGPGGSRLDLLSTWAPQSTNASSPTNGDPLTHAFHTANLLPDGTILLAGGTDGARVLSSAEIFNPANQTFTPTATPLTVPREQHSASLLPNGRILLAGGITTATASTSTISSAEIYYPDSKTFIPTAAMISSHSQHVAITLPDGNVFIAGGYSGAAISASAEIYYSTADAWFPLASMPVGRAIAAAVELKDGTILVCGGTSQSGNLASVVIYNPATNAWTTLGSDPMPAALQGHTATLLNDGRVLVTGGDDSFGETAATYIYDPAATAGSRWSTVSPLNTARIGHSATLLPNGTVLVSGGTQINGASNSANAVQSLEYFHTDDQGWSTTTFKNGPRSFHTATLASDGNVYFIGGANGSIGQQQSASFYTSYESVYLTMAPDQYAITAPSLRQSTITFTTASPFLPGAAFTASGLRFRGATEASGGMGPANSSFSDPRLLLQRIDGSGGGSAPAGFLVDLTTQIYANPANQTTLDTSLTVPLPGTSSGLPYGWYMTWVGDNDIYTGHAPFVQVGPPLPTAAPAAASGTALGISSISWTWNALVGAGIDGYNVYRATDGVFIGTVAATAASPSIVETGLPANANVQIRVAGYTISGDGPSTLSAFAAVNQRGVVSTVGCGPTQSGDTTTSIPWNWNDAGAVDRYNIYNSTTGLLIGTAARGNPAFYDAGLGTNTSRSIMVSAVASGVESQLLASPTCYTLAAVPATSMPAAPLMTSTETASVSLNWKSNGNPNGTIYQVYFYSYASTSSSSGIAVTTITSPAQTSSYLQTYIGGLSPSSYYSASVAALNGANVASAALSAGTTYTLPAQPQPLAIQGTTPNSISGSWNTNSNSTMTYYQLTYSLDNFATNIATAIPFSSRYGGSSFTVAGLITSTPYWFRVQAENPFGQTSAFSAAIATSPFNGGAPSGSLAGVLTAIGSSQFSGNLGDGTLLTLRSPSGAFTADTTVTISTYDTSGIGHGPLCPNGVVNTPGGQAMAFSITDNPAFQPARPLYLGASYNPAEIAGPVSQVSLSRYEPVSGTCVPLQTTFDAAAKTFLAELNHFSLYQLVQVPPAASADTARVFPNPYRAAADGYVTIDQIPPASRVRVMTLRGEKILDATAGGSGLLTWSGTNAAGRPVASGLYLVVVESGGSTKISKLAVIR